MAQKTVQAHLNNRNSSQISKSVGKNIDSLIFSIEKLTKCDLCENRYVHPKILPCQHTYCSFCLSKYLQESKGLECPKCQLPVQCKREEVDSFTKSLPLNSLVTSLLEELTKHELKFDVQLAHAKRCEQCKKIVEDGPRDRFCEHCRQIYCDSCWPDHLRSLLDSFNSFDDDLRDLETNLHNFYEEFLEQCDDTTNKIKETTATKINDLKRKESNCFEMIDKLKNQQKITTNTISQKIYELKTQSTKILEDDSKVLAFGNISNEIHSISEDVASVKSTKLNFNENTFELEQIEAVFDQVDHHRMLIKTQDDAIAYYSSKSFKPKLYWTKCPRPAGLGVPPWAPDLLYLSSADNGTVLILKRHNFAIVGTLSNPEMMLSPHEIAFCLRRMEIYVSDKLKHCIHVFSANKDKYLKTIWLSVSGKSDKYQTPGGLAVDSRGRLVVCSTAIDTVVFVDPESGKITGTLGMTDKFKTELQTPTQVVTHKDVIIVADVGNFRIKIFDLSGKMLHEFGSLGTERGKFKAIDAIACDPTGLIFVGDSLNQRVQVFQQDGTVVRVFSGHRKRLRMINSLSGILVTPQFEIIITDYKNKSLLLV